MDQCPPNIQVEMTLLIRIALRLMYASRPHHCHSRSLSPLVAVAQALHGSRSAGFLLGTMEQAAGTPQPAATGPRLLWVSLTPNDVTDTGKSAGDVTAHAQTQRLLPLPDMSQW